MPAARQGRPLLIAFFTIFLDLLGFGLVIPVQAFYAESFGATAKVITLLGASYSLMQFLFASFWGRLSDRYGRRPIVLFSVLISGLGHLMFGLAPTLAWLFVARAVAGFGNANLGTAQAIISDVTTPETRAKGMGILGAAFGLGFIFGPAVGGFLSQISPTAPFFAAAALAGLNFISAWFLLPETRRVYEGGASPAGRHLLSLTALRSAVQLVNVKAIFILSFVVTVGFAMMEHTVGLLIEHTWLTTDELTSEARIKTAAKLTAWFLVAVGVTATIVQGGLIGRLQRAFGEVRLCQSGLLILVVSLATVPWMVGALSMSLLLLSACLLALGSGLLNPSASSLLSRSIPAGEQGGVLGLNQSFSALGRVFGPAVAGTLFDFMNGMPFYAGATLVLVGFVVSLQLKKPQIDTAKA